MWVAWVIIIIQLLIPGQNVGGIEESSLYNIYKGSMIETDCLCSSIIEY